MNLPAQQNEHIQLTRRTSISLEENGVCATFQNPKKSVIRIIHYDNHYYKGRGEKADYIIGQREKIDIIVELKSSDIAHACEQIKTTLERWREDANRYPKIACLIVYSLSSRLPRISSRRQARELDFTRENRTLLLIRANNEQKYKFSEFV